MEKPGWATFIGILMLLIGGCGAFDNISDMNTDKMIEIQNQIKSDLDAEVEVNVEIDTSNSEKIDSTGEKIISIFGDSIVRDSNDNLDIKKTFEGITKISDYRIKWIKTFAYIGVFISLLFLISGIFLLSQRKFTIQIVILTLALSLALGMFQFIIFRADVGTSNMIDNLSNIGIYVSLFIDILLLICIMVLDKSYYNEVLVNEDYYDTSS